MRTAAARLLLACFSLSTAILFFLAIGVGGAAAVNADGTWTQRVSGEGFVQDTWPADWHYDVTLKLGSPNTWWMKVVRVTNVQPGQESARQTVGNSFTYPVSYTSTASGINLRMEGKTLALTVSGGRMSGSGTYSMDDGSTVRWSVDLEGGSGIGGMGDMASVAMAGTAVGVVGAVAGMAAAAIPAPRPIPIRSDPGLQNLQARPPNPQHGPYERWVGQPPPVYPNAPPQRPYTVAPGDARPFEPVPFIPPTPDPNLTLSLGGAGITQGPPDTPPPPTPPRGNETQNDNNPTCPRCHSKTLPTSTPTVYGYRWQCRACGGWLPWG